MTPIVAVGGVAVDASGRVLLIQRGHEPGLGLWTIPGGRVELGESLAEACVRELREETGLEVRVDRHLLTLDRIGRDERGEVTYHFVIVDYLVGVTGGSLCAAGDARAAAWLSLAEAEARPHTAGLLAVLEQAIAFTAKPG